MKNIVPLILASLLAPAGAFAQAGALSALRELAPETPLLSAPAPQAAPDYASSYGDFEGYQKPAMLLGSEGDSYTVAGVRGSHLPENRDIFEWDTMTVRPDLVEEAYWGYESGGVGHSYLVFAFKPGGLTDQRGRDIAGLVVSAEAWYRKGEAYKPLTLGVQDHYPLIWVLSTWDSFAEFEFRANTRNLHVSPLKISSARKAALVRVGVREGVKSRPGDYYHTFKNSCTNLPMGMIGEVIGKDFRFFKVVPLAGRARLKADGLIAEGFKVTPENWRGFRIRPSER